MQIKLLSGGQTGADRGALDASIELGIEHGGYCPKGRMSESGPIPDRYKLQELDSRNYVDRTIANIKAADATLIFHFGERLTPGSQLTEAQCFRLGKPVLTLQVNKMGLIGNEVSSIVAWLVAKKVCVLNVAGSRESKAIGIGDTVRRIMRDILSGWQGEIAKIGV